jgi:hypothetical protein
VALFWWTGVPEVGLIAAAAVKISCDRGVLRGGGIDIGIGQLSASCGRLMRLRLMQTNAGKVPERFTGRDI